MKKKRQLRKKKTSPVYSENKSGRPTFVSDGPLAKVLFFLFCFFLPTQLGKHFFLPFSYITGVRIDYLAPTLYLTDILAFLLFALHLRLILPVFKRNRIVLVLLIIAAINFAFALSKPLFFYRFIKLIEIAALFFLFAKKYGPNKKYIIAGLAIGTFVQTIPVLGQLALKHSLQGIWYFLGERMFSLGTPGIAKAALQGVEFLRPYGTFSHPNSLAGFYLLVGLYFLVNKDITNLFLKYAVIFLSSLFVFFSFSKNAIVVYLVLNFLFAWKTKGCRLCTAASLFFSLAVALLFLFAQTDILSFAKRFTLITQSLEIIKTYPLGVGLGSYLIGQAAFPIPYPYFFLQPVHNIFLYLAAEVGIPFSLLLSYFIVRFLGKNRSLPFFLLTGAVFATGMLDHYWLTLQQNMLVGAILLGSVLYNSKHGEKKTG